ncbi:MAG: hypothetical protein IT204_17245 [Fimbriimonadaceae bacterium]|nr:hypothetical protein [Fimbriimonadaceae bacterium]
MFFKRLLGRPPSATLPEAPDDDPQAVAGGTPVDVTAPDSGPAEEASRQAAALEDLLRRLHRELYRAAKGQPLGRDLPLARLCESLDLFCHQLHAGAYQLQRVGPAADSAAPESDAPNFAAESADVGCAQEGPAPALVAAPAAVETAPAVAEPTDDGAPGGETHQDEPPWQRLLRQMESGEPRSGLDFLVAMLKDLEAVPIAVMSALESGDQGQRLRELRHRLDRALHERLDLALVESALGADEAQVLVVEVGQRRTQALANLRAAGVERIDPTQGSPFHPGEVVPKPGLAVRPTRRADWHGRVAEVCPGDAGYRLAGRVICPALARQYEYTGDRTTDSP